MASIINASTTGVGGVITTADNTGILTLQTASTTAVTIDASQRAAFVAGTAALPAITTTGDTNTGIFFPAADTIAFAEGGAEAMRLDSVGNVGIGNTAPNTRLHVQGGTNADGSLTYNQQLTSTAAFNASPATGTLVSLQFNSGGSYAGMGGWSVNKENATDGNFASYFALHTRPNGGSTTERMRITSGGEVYIAGTTDQGAYNLQCNGTGVWGAGAYVNGSDARIKENIVSIDSGLDVVAKLNPVTYTYKDEWSKDQSTQTGFIAQELLVALEGKNYVDGIVQQGGEYMSVAYQNIIPILTKAIQEQQTIINDLKARITVLEAK